MLSIKWSTEPQHNDLFKSCVCHQQEQNCDFQAPKAKRSESMAVVSTESQQNKSDCRTYATQGRHLSIIHAQSYLPILLDCRVVAICLSMYCRSFCPPRIWNDRYRLPTNWCSPILIHDHVLSIVHVVGYQAIFGAVGPASISF